MMVINYVDYGCSLAVLPEYRYPFFADRLLAAGRSICGFDEDQHAAEQLYVFENRRFRQKRYCIAAGSGVCQQ